MYAWGALCIQKYRYRDVMWRRAKKEEEAEERKTKNEIGICWQRIRWSVKQ